MKKPIRVLIVDDSAIVRRILSDKLSAEPDIVVAGTAPDAYAARDKIIELEPDVLTLDIEMPRMDGISFLKRLMRYRPMPVVVISSAAQKGCLTALKALEAGAVEVLAKPSGLYSVGELQMVLANKIRCAASARIGDRASTGRELIQREVRVPARSGSAAALIAIGASTGGTEAIRAVLEATPEGAPPIVIVQHIPSGFSTAFADRLNQLCRIEVREAQDGDLLRPGLALVAPGGFHMLVRKHGPELRVEVKTGPRVCYQRPSVDVLFQSAAAAVGPAAIGILLTGMGSDGAEGLLAMKQAGAHTIAQDEQTSVVYGMPREAVARGAVDRILPLGAIAQAMLRQPLISRNASSISARASGGTTVSGSRGGPP